MCTWRQMPFPTCWGRKPSKESKKGGAEGSVAVLKESIHLGRVSQDSYPRKSILREPGRSGSKHAVKFSKGTWHHMEIRERKGPSQWVTQKWEPQERNPCAPKFDARIQEETLQQERCARRVAWDLAKDIYKLKNADRAILKTPLGARVMLAPTSKSPEERAFVVD